MQRSDRNTIRRDQPRLLYLVIIMLPLIPAAFGDNKVSGQTHFSQRKNFSAAERKDLRAFYGSVAIKIAAHWIAPVPQISPGARITFTITKAGKIGDVSVEQSSGDEGEDSAAIAAIKTSEPFPPPPAAALEGMKFLFSTGNYSESGLYDDASAFLALELEPGSTMSASIKPRNQVAKKKGILSLQSPKYCEFLIRSATEDLNRKAVGPAAKKFQQAVDLAGKDVSAANNSNKTNALIGLARTYLSWGQLDRVKQPLADADRLADQLIKDRKTSQAAKLARSEILQLRCQFWIRQKQDNEALFCLRQAIDFADKNKGLGIEDLNKEMFKFNRLFKGARESAGETFFRTLFVATKRISAPDSRSCTFASASLGLALMNAGKLMEAEGLLKQAYALSQNNLPKSDENAVHIAEYLAQLYARTGQLDNARAVREHLIEIQPENNDNIHNTRLSDLRSLVDICAQKHDYAAAEAYLTKYSALAKSVSKRRSIEIEDLRMRADLEEQQAKFDQAEKLYDQISALPIQSGEQRYPRQLDNCIYFYKQHHIFNKLEELTKRRIELESKEDSGRWRTRANLFNELAYYYFVQGKYKEAEALLREIKSLKESHDEACDFPGDDCGMHAPDYNIVLTSLANCCLDGTGKYNEATELYSHLYQGPITKFCLALSLDAQGKNIEANKIYNDLTKEVNKQRNSNKEPTRTALIRWGNLCNQSRKDAIANRLQMMECFSDLWKVDGSFEAESVGMRAYIMRSKDWGAFDIRRVPLLKKLAANEYGQLDILHSQPFIFQMLAILQKQAHPNQLEIAEVKTQLALTYQHRWPAELLYRQALAVYKRELPVNSLKLAELLKLLGESCMFSGSINDAETFLKDSFAIYSNQKPKDTRSCSEIQMLLGMANELTGKIDEAKKYYSDSYARFSAPNKSVAPVENQSFQSLESMRNLEEFYRTSDRAKEAVILGRRYIELGRQRRLPLSSIIWAEKYVGDALCKEGKTDEAAAWLRHCIEKDTKTGGNQEQDTLKWLQKDLDRLQANPKNKLKF